MVSRRSHLVHAEPVQERAVTAVGEVTVDSSADAVVAVADSEVTGTSVVVDAVVLVPVVVPGARRRRARSKRATLA